MSALARGSVAAVSFDYGHMLGGIDFDELVRRVLAPSGADPAALAAAARASRAAFQRAYDAHDAAIASGLGHERGWHAMMETFVEAAGVSRDEAPSHVAALWRAQPTQNLWRAVPDEARTLLEWLALNDVPMVLTSNSEGGVALLCTQVRIDRYFKRILDSGVLGFAKPDPRIFALAVDAVGVPAAHVVHLGDSEMADVIGAKSAGLRAIRFDGFDVTGSARPTIADAKTASFDELRALLAHALDR